MAANYMLTTIDNPYDPFDQFPNWLLYDTLHGYNTCGYLARVANITDDLSQKEECEEINRAIDQIIADDFMNIYKKVLPKTAISK